MRPPSIVKGRGTFTLAKVRELASDKMLENEEYSAEGPSKSLESMQRDGNCCSRAVSQAAYLDQSHHQTLRRLGVWTLALFPEQFEDMVKSQSEPEQTYEEKLREMWQLGEFAGHLEILAYRMVTGLTINVTSVAELTNGEALVAREQDKAKSPRGRAELVLFKEHYYVLQPGGKKVPSPPFEKSDLQPPGSVEFAYLRELQAFSQALGKSGYTSSSRSWSAEIISTCQSWLKPVNQLHLVNPDPDIPKSYRMGEWKDKLNNIPFLGDVAKLVATKYHTLSSEPRLTARQVKDQLMMMFIDQFMMRVNMMDAMAQRESGLESEMPRAWVAFVQAILLTLREPNLDLMDETEMIKQEEIGNTFGKLSRPEPAAEPDRVDPLPVVSSSSYSLLPIRTPQTYSSVTVKREEVGWRNLKSGLQIKIPAQGAPLNLQMNTMNQHLHPPGTSTDNRLTQNFHGTVSGNQFSQADGGFRGGQFSNGERGISGATVNQHLPLSLPNQSNPRSVPPRPRQNHPTSNTRQSYFRAGAPPKVRRKNMMTANKSRWVRRHSKSCGMKWI